MASSCLTAPLCSSPHAIDSIRDLSAIRGMMSNGSRSVRVLRSNARGPVVKSRPYRNVLVPAVNGEGESDPLEDIAKGIQEKWESTDDKLALFSLGLFALVVTWASTGVVNALDKLPLIPDLVESVGILFSAWFMYRYLLFNPGREELQGKIEEIKKLILGE